ncbi:unnamed protein product [Vitrella brassicaformis CCMP3155]|uniref:Uncharacterized protein n=2 Tax=Vitrella brassicaformis TaxID=1169539 RepID=A0A0G4FHC0_VITBC|nr:unnamed protein product [Vitrella brassicaformis CCMP3155]|eukprot:CEM12822.1 unnamed protein product [Vitrella brassicaformis CCMP3155]
MEEGDRQVRWSCCGDAPAAAASTASASAGGGSGESDEERQRRQETESDLRQQIADTPGLLSTVMAFLPIHLLMQLQLPPLTWQHAARKQHHLTMSAAAEDERFFWQRTTIDLVTEWATYLTKLACVVLCYPLGFPMWCLHVFVALVEGHVAGRVAANMDGGTLQTITIEEGVRLTDAARRTVTRTHPALPAPLDAPPTLHALTTIAGLTHHHHGLAYRGWQMPSLAIVRPEGWWADRLRRLISSSRSLQHIDGAYWGDEWARVFEVIPEAPAGRQGGPLRNFESIGTILVELDNPAGIDRLQEALLTRGCRRSLKQLHVRFSARYAISRYTLPVLLAVERLVVACCRSDAQLAVTTTGLLQLDLSIFYATDFPSRPSPPFKTVIQQLARQATSVMYVFSQDGLTDPHTDPRPAAIDIASSLSFDKAETVSVQNAFGFYPPANTPSPHPAIITHLQPFPKTSQLCVWSEMGGAAGRLLAAKVPKKVQGVRLRWMSGGEENVGVLAALGRGREVDVVPMGEIGVDQLDPLLGAADELPTIRELEFTMTLPDDVEDAGSVVRARLSSLTDHTMHLRGLQSVKLLVDKTTPEQRGSIDAFLLDGAKIDGFSIRRISGWDTRLLLGAARNG